MNHNNKLHFLTLKQCMNHRQNESVSMFCGSVNTHHMSAACMQSHMCTILSIITIHWRLTCFMHRKMSRSTRALDHLDEVALCLLEYYSTSHFLIAMVKEIAKHYLHQSHHLIFNPQRAVCDIWHTKHPAPPSRQLTPDLHS